MQELVWAKIFLHKGLELFKGYIIYSKFCRANPQDVEQAGFCLRVFEFKYDTMHNNNFLN